MADEDETFESTDAGSSETYPMEAGQIRKGGFIMIKGNPCKVSDVSTSKTGKHGHAKCHFVAIDIFTGKKMEDLVPSSHTTSVPFVKKEEFQCMCAPRRARAATAAAPPPPVAVSHGALLFFPARRAALPARTERVPSLVPAR